MMKPETGFQCEWRKPAYQGFWRIVRRHTHTRYVYRYFFNPTYLVTRPDGTAIARLSKEKSFFGRSFSVDKLAEFETGEENRLLLGPDDDDLAWETARITF